MTNTLSATVTDARAAVLTTDHVLDHVHSFAPMLAHLEKEAPRVREWARVLAERLIAGHRLLVAGNGGSAAQAQHLTGELVGRFDGERRPFSAIALSTETSTLTAIGNDYGYDEVFARQVRGHGRAGDILITLSTSGRSRNLVRAAEAARECELTCWTMTGAAPNRLELTSDDRVCLPGLAAHVQEGQLILIHALCRAFDAEIAARERAAA
jgi:phosphoheptose isomerase